MYEEMLQEMSSPSVRPAKSKETVGEDQYKKRCAFRFGHIGLGQAGGNLASVAYMLGARKLFLVNTAEADTNSIKIDDIPKVLVGKDGTAKNRKEGRDSALKKRTEIFNAMERVFDDKVDKIMIYLSLGGGTGSGAGPEVIKMAQEYVRERGGDPACDVLVTTIIPQKTIDSDYVCFNALQAYGEISRLGVPYITLDNTKLIKHHKPMVRNYWGRMNYWTIDTLLNFNFYAAMSSEIGNFDPREFNDVLSQGRFMYTMFKVPIGGNRYDIGDELNAHLEQSVFADTDLESAKKGACILALNQDTIDEDKLEMVTSAFAKLNQKMRKGSTLHYGMYIEPFGQPSPGEEPSDLYGYVMLGGLDHPMPTLESLYEKARSCKEAENYGSISVFLEAQD